MTFADDDNPRGKPSPVCSKCGRADCANPGNCGG